MRSLVFVVCAALGWGAALAQATSTAVQLRGSPTLLPMAQSLAESYMHANPNVSVVVSGGGTYRGYKSVLDGTADVAMVSSDAQDDVRQLLGRPGEVRMLGRARGMVWSYRYDNYSCLWFQVELSLQQQVRSVGYGQPPECEPPNDRADR